MLHGKNLPTKPYFTGVSVQVCRSMRLEGSYTVTAMV